MEGEDNRLSTTALAKKLNIPVQQLFATLKDYGWIQRAGDTWVLTPKGEFEGGSYQQSRRFGRYIVWPERLDHHPLLAAIESNQRITAASMCRYYPRLHARQINRALAELGLQHHSLLGWELTPLGRTLGGQQEESANSGAFYVTWPHEIIDHPVIHRELTRQSDQIQPPEPVGTESEPDLFASAARSSVSCDGIDGHRLQTTPTSGRYPPRNWSVRISMFRRAACISTAGMRTFPSRNCRENCTVASCTVISSCATWRSMPGMWTSWMKFLAGVYWPSACAGSYCFRRRSTPHSM
jgi:hypothetical protein